MQNDYIVEEGVGARGDNFLNKRVIIIKTNYFFNYEFG